MNSELWNVCFLDAQHQLSEPASSSSVAVVENVLLQPFALLIRGPFGRGDSRGGDCWTGWWGYVEHSALNIEFGKAGQGLFSRAKVLRRKGGASLPERAGCCPGAVICAVI